jgi:hypothetical protein
LETAKRGSVAGRAQIAYVIPYQTDGAGVFAIRLLKENFRVAVATKTLTAGGRNYNRGTFVVRVTRNPETVHEAVNRLAKELGVSVFAVNTGYTDEGDTNVGSENVVSLQMPKIAMVADETVSQTSYGSIWWTLNRYGIDFTPLTVANIKGGALKNYTILIMPDGSPSRYFGAMGKRRRVGTERMDFRRRNFDYRQRRVGFRRAQRCRADFFKTRRQRPGRRKRKSNRRRRNDKRKEVETRPSATPEKPKAKSQTVENEPNKTQELKSTKPTAFRPLCRRLRRLLQTPEQFPNRFPVRLCARPLTAQLI